MWARCPDDVLLQEVQKSDARTCPNVGLPAVSQLVLLTLERSRDNEKSDRIEPLIELFKKKWSYVLPRVNVSFNNNFKKGSMSSYLNDEAPGLFFIFL